MLRRVDHSGLSFNLVAITVTQIKCIWPNLSVPVSNHLGHIKNGSVSQKVGSRKEVVGRDNVHKEVVGHLSNLEVHFRDEGQVEFGVFGDLVVALAEEPQEEAADDMPAPCSPILLYIPLPLPMLFK